MKAPDIILSSTVGLGWLFVRLDMLYKLTIRILIIFFCLRVLEVASFQEKTT
jgi:hypothetical protein